MRRLALALALLLSVAVSIDATRAHAQPPAEAPAEATSGDEGDSEEIWEGYWFWLAISSVVLGITTAIIVDVTTDDPAPSDPMDPGMTGMGLRLRF